MLIHPHLQMSTPSVREMIMRLHQIYGTVVWTIFQGGEMTVSLEMKYSTHYISLTQINALYFSDAGKYAQQIKKGAIRSTGVLELIHIGICGPFSVKLVDGFDSFITFTNDYSCYGYIYPIKDQSEALDKFKVFKAEVGNQHNCKIKTVRSDRGGEYYGRHTPYGQIPGPFARFLQKNSIVV